MITRIDHIGIAVKSIDDALKLYAGALGLEVKDIEVVESQKVRTAIIPVGESKIELLESTDPEGVIARYIEKRGEGLHHLALAVSDIEQALSNLRGKQVPLIDEKPRNGVEETRIAFLHPKAAGVLIELVEPKK
ncbi:MAG: methylmalonyl-CoA epimerase [Dehalococcoidales bacterium]|nr:methylmalonyl-CoA epimerase [Dehalococcoidales bacterium]